MVPGLGLEPRLSAPEALVLPLHNPGVFTAAFGGFLIFISSRILGALPALGIAGQNKN